MSSSRVDREAPTFYPTKEEFDDFAGYVTSLAASCAEYGLCKIVPPETWSGPASSLQKPRSQAGFVVHSPIEQHVTGKNGVYQVFNQERVRMSLDRFERQVSVFTHPIPSHRLNARHDAGRCY